MASLSLVDAVIHHTNNNSLAHRAAQTKVELTSSEKTSGAANNADSSEGQGAGDTGRKGEETGWLLSEIPLCLFSVQ